MRGRLLLAVALPILQPALTAQSPIWVPLGGPDLTVERMAWDTLRDRAVLYGLSQSFAPETWEWDGVVWTQRHSSQIPQARINTTMAYDEARRVTVLFGGGVSTTTFLNDTWIWDGNDWTQLFPATSPSGRASAAMAYDSDRQVIVMQGGEDSTDTWIWNGTDWSVASTNALCRSFHSMAYDPVRRRMVTFGGIFAGQETDKLAEWDGTSWTEYSLSGTGPGYRSGCSLWYDSEQQRVVVFGGYSAMGLQSDLWEWDGLSMVQRTPTYTPPGRGGAAAYDPATKRAVIHGGGQLIRDTWTWDGNVWSQPEANPSLQPSRDGGWGATAYDSARERIVYCGTIFRDGLGYMETWEWNGSVWEQKFPVSSPSPARKVGAIAYDAVRQRTVLFSGGAAADTWLWDGSDWTQAFPPTSPPPSEDHLMAYDAAREVVIKVGGSDPTAGSNTQFHWEWNGVTWVQRIVSPVPFVRNRPAAMTYDVARQQAVLTGNTPNIETWVWDGANWEKRSPNQTPAQVESMAYDASQQLVIAFGTDGYGTWTAQWNGTDWWRVPDTGGPYRRANGSICYYPPLQRTVMLDDTSTWIYGRTVAASASLFGAACAGSTGPLGIDGYGLPRVGSATFGIDLFSLGSGASAVTMLAINPASIPLGGGCTFYLDPATTVAAVPVVANSWGQTRLPLSIADDPAFIGARFYAQGVAADSLGPFVGLVFSPRLDLISGQ